MAFNATKHCLFVHNILVIVYYLHYNIPLVPVIIILLLALNGTPTIAQNQDSLFKRTVTSVHPSEYALGVSPGNSVWVTFSEPMDTSSFNDSLTFIVEGEESGLHSGTFRFTSRNHVVEFIPDTQFIEGEIVRVRLTAGLMTTDNWPTIFHTSSFQINKAVSEDPSSKGIPPLLKSILSIIGLVLLYGLPVYIIYDKLRVLRDEDNYPLIVNWGIIPIRTSNHSYAKFWLGLGIFLLCIELLIPLMILSGPG